MSSLLFYAIMQLVMFNEGFEPEPYQDTKGIWTVGYGYNLSVRMPNPPCADYKCLLWTKADAFNHLTQDVLRINNRLKVRLDCYEQLPLKGQIVMIDMAYNMGLNGLFGFDELLVSICVKDYKQAGENILDSDYANDVRLRARRNVKILKDGYEI